MSKDPVEIGLEQWPAFDWPRSTKASHLLNQLLCKAPSRQL